MAKSQLCDKQICLLSFNLKVQKNRFRPVLARHFLTGIHRFLKIYFCPVLTFTSIGQLHATAQVVWQTNILNF